LKRVINMNSILFPTFRGESSLKNGVLSIQH